MCVCVCVFAGHELVAAVERAVASDFYTREQQEQEQERGELRLLLSLLLQQRA